MKISKCGQIYILFLRWFRWLPNTPKFLSGVVWRLQSLWRAVWLGLLDADDLNGVTWAYYIGKSGFEEEDFNIHQGLWPWETDAVRKLLKTVSICW